MLSANSTVSSVYVGRPSRGSHEKYKTGSVFQILVQKNVCERLLRCRHHCYCRASFSRAGRFERPTTNYCHYYRHPSRYFPAHVPNVASQVVRIARVKHVPSSGEASDSHFLEPRLLFHTISPLLLPVVSDTGRNISISAGRGRIISADSGCWCAW